MVAHWQRTVWITVIRLLFFPIYLHNNGNGRSNNSRLILLFSLYPIHFTIHSFILSTLLCVCRQKCAAFYMVDSIPSSAHVFIPLYNFIHIKVNNFCFRFSCTFFVFTTISRTNAFIRIRRVLFLVEHEIGRTQPKRYC
jgi:hypothetical protein